MKGEAERARLAAKAEKARLAAEAEAAAAQAAAARAADVEVARSRLQKMDTQAKKSDDEEHAESVAQDAAPDASSLKDAAVVNFSGLFRGECDAGVQGAKEGAKSLGVGDYSDDFEDDTDSKEKSDQCGTEGNIAVRLPFPARHSSSLATRAPSAANEVRARWDAAEAGSTQLAGNSKAYRTNVMAVPLGPVSDAAGVSALVADCA